MLLVRNKNVALVRILRIVHPSEPKHIVFLFRSQSPSLVRVCARAHTCALAFFPFFIRIGESLNIWRHPGISLSRHGGVVICR